MGELNVFGHFLTFNFEDQQRGRVREKEQAQKKITTLICCAIVIFSKILGNIIIKYNKKNEEKKIT